jgi:dihydroorotase
VFIERTLAPLVRRLPELRIVLEHVTTAEAVAFVREASATVAATITPQHLRLDRNAMFEGGFRPHAYCLPVLKRETHRRALVDAATSGDPKFFLGTDSAPHEVRTKETACGCAGMFNAPVALAIYAEVFDDAGALPRLCGFAAEHGRSFYGLAPTSERIALVRAAWDVPTSYRLGGGMVVPMRAGGEAAWRLEAASR